MSKPSDRRPKSARYRKLTCEQLKPRNVRAADLINCWDGAEEAVQSPWFEQAESPIAANFSAPQDSIVWRQVFADSDGAVPQEAGNGQDLQSFDEYHGEGEDQPASTGSGPGGSNGMSYSGSGQYSRGSGYSGSGQVSGQTSNGMSYSTSAGYSQGSGASVGASISQQISQGLSGSAGASYSQSTGASGSAGLSYSNSRGVSGGISGSVSEGGGSSVSAGVSIPLGSGSGSRGRSGSWFSNPGSGSRSR